MKKKVILTKDQLKQLKSQLPHGYRHEIKKITKFSYSYIDMVLKEERFNQEIIDCALALGYKSEQEKRSSRSVYYRLTGPKVEHKSSDNK